MNPKRLEQAERDNPYEFLEDDSQPIDGLIEVFEQES